jgi:ABC-2 type transport system permease protein
VTGTSETGGRATVRNVWLVARREYGERVGTRAFVISTLLLMGLAIVVALVPLAIRAADRASVTKVLVAAPDAALASQTTSTLEAFVNSGGGGGGGRTAFVLQVVDGPDKAIDAVRNGTVAGAVLVSRTTDGGLDFKVVTVGGLAQDRLLVLQLGTFGVGVVDYTRQHPAPAGGAPFEAPTFAVVDAGAAAGGGGGPSVDTSEYASRRIVGIVFVVLSFLTLVFYGLWVASGVVSEKASRVMELLISAATARQLVLGKILGIGLAGLTQVLLVLGPALVVMVASGRLGNAVFGEDPTAATSLAGLTPGLVAAFLVYFTLGFALYAALYGAAGSLLSRAEDLQMIALPLSIPAIMGYLPAVLALSGSTSWLIRIASYVPLWSPFVMVSRLAIGRVEPWELVLSLGLLIATLPFVMLLAIRVYRAGVVLYGQPPTVATFVRAVRGS